ncbi:hypothetical protein E4U22_004326 [Claviceps purpurea]|nr:hypothetical protein E4U12_007965 [Claviceps purpurea]KAG6158628.1 hypothetical protein E4U37_005442 [Claviceps purpurea]KAG6212468.1 hypothetical protein E4U35_005762 [Claviceps purpurea]KAG6254790.1 hypothetical protein E4U24_007220 [Claviceps purpurea]KAG6277055.1 hypothetical protein E4U48_001352 [Claviceps purpurea]
MRAINHLRRNARGTFAAAAVLPLSPAYVALQMATLSLLSIFGYKQSLSPSPTTHFWQLRYDLHRMARESTPPHQNGDHMSDREYTIFNRLAETMDQYHDYFRRNYDFIYNAARTSRRPRHLTEEEFLLSAISLVDEINGHHTTEETHIFPHLATRMPEFDSRRGQLVQQHAVIHRGLVDFEDYVQDCLNGQVLEMDVLREKMDSWGSALMQHMDEEVRMLKADRMIRIWTKDEMQHLPI